MLPIDVPGLHGNRVSEPAGRVLPPGLTSAKDWPPPPFMKSGFFTREKAVASMAPKGCKGCRGAQGGGLHDHLDYFDWVVCVNLDRRKDRWARFTEQLRAADWPFRSVDRFVAVDGHACPPPKGWNWGAGAWGCMQSHRQVLERALMEGHDRILVLEDDAFFVEGFGDKVRMFLKEVDRWNPAWDCLMLGGQHIEKAVGITDSIDLCKNTQRTHAYALQGPIIRDLYQEWCSRMGHCDHVMGPFCGRRKTFAPTKFLVGQDEGHSDIKNAGDRPRLWQEPKELEVVVLVGDRQRFEEEIQTRGHGGYNRNPLTGCDKGIEGLVKDGVFNLEKLKAWWYPMVSWEAEAIGRRLVVWHPEMALWAPLVASALKGTVVQ